MLHFLEIERGREKNKMQKGNLGAKATRGEKRYFRYNLPVNTRMCRVAVDAIPMASPSTKSKTGQPTAQPPATATPTSPQSDSPQDTLTTSEA